jgi:hypothetical protein
VTTAVPEGDSWLDRKVSPSFLFVAGLLLAPAVIFQPNLVIKVAQTALFLSLAVWLVPSGRRRLVVGSVVFMATTIVVNLFSPAGRVLLRIGPFPVTRDAMEIGISKATTLASLLYLSRTFVRPSVQLPGVVGRTVSLTFDYLNRLVAGRQRLMGRNWARRVDELFAGIYAEQRDAGGPAPGPRTAPCAVVAVVSLLVVNWSSVFFPFSILLREG